MKFRKPQLNEATAGAFYREACERFIAELPDEFEILGPGEVAVKWPAEYSRDRLLSEADFAERTNSTNEYRFASCVQVLRALAAIAPEKRMVSLYKKNDGSLIVVPYDNRIVYQGWRKVAGPIEIDD